MPRFSFCLRSADHEEVDEIELPNARAAEREALRASSDLIRELDCNPDPCWRWDLEVLDDSRNRILHLHFAADREEGSSIIIR
ncbi:DUF6894 family protein [Pararhizobium mangrovi]|uniref:DUF6894 domain-containing protein n=1 Tax=Pararhizobium mangrovi TaxID=2590452 RepID=A0A506U5B9_9HYPH|nr:hypothetical protein [Pararhizobium mangrovi]TPW29553.1 hypothetical protein FJU11_07545 [Pararhizobium mangrovi]